MQVLVTFWVLKKFILQILMKNQDFSFYLKTISSSRAVKILFISFMCEDIGVAMEFFSSSLEFRLSLEQKISVLLSLFLFNNFISEFHNIFVTGILRKYLMLKVSLTRR